MTDERYKAIMANLGMPNSRSLLLALQQVANEVAQAERVKYDELIMAVGNKWPGESRHETALRYIREAEVGAGGTAAKGSNVQGQGDGERSSSISPATPGSASPAPSSGG